MRYKIFVTLVIVIIVSGFFVVRSFINRPIEFSSEDFKNVILIGWDGVDVNYLHELLDKGELPNLKKLIGEGILVNTFITTGATDTKAGWAEILTGYGPEITDVWDNKYYRPVPSGYTIFERLEDHFGKENIATVFLTGKHNNLGARGSHRLCLNCLPRDPKTRMKMSNLIMKSLSSAVDYKEQYEPVRREAPASPGTGRETIIDHEQGPFVLMPPHKEMMLDPREREGEPYYYAKDNVDVYLSNLGNGFEVGSRALAYLEQYQAERFFMFFHFEEADEQGHRWGGGSPEYTKGLILADEWLGQIVFKLKELELYKETLLYVTTDHGFETAGVVEHRGFEHRQQSHTFLATNDMAVQRGGNRKDITPTILSRYGIVLGDIFPKLNGASLIDEK